MFVPVMSIYWSWSQLAWGRDHSQILTDMKGVKYLELFGNRIIFKYFKYSIDPFKKMINN